MEYRTLLLAAAVALLAAGCASPPPQTTAEGLVSRASSRLDEVYMRPDGLFRTYRKVSIEPVTVRFRADYLSSQHAYSRGKELGVPYDDPQVMANEMAALLRASLVAALSQAGYEIVAAADPAAMRVTAKAEELYVNAPERFSASTQRVLTREAGTAILRLEVRDPSGNEVLARVAHHATARQANRLETTDSATSRSWFDTLFRRWATDCAAALTQ